MNNSRRTGHTTSAMLAKYRRAAENLAEGGGANLGPMAEVVTGLSADSSNVSAAGGCYPDAAALSTDSALFEPLPTVELTRIERAASRVRF